MEMDRLELGALIRKRRKEMGLTLNDLANGQVSVPTISNIERGAVYNVGKDKLSYILDQLGLTEETIARMEKESQDEQRELAMRLSIARHLIQLKLYNEARNELSELEQERLDDYPYYAMSVKLQKGIIYRKLNQWSRAKRTLQKVIRMARESGLDQRCQIIAEAYYFLALCAFYGDQDYEKAIEHADAALDNFQEDGDNLYQKGRITYDKANYYYHLGHYGSAYKHVLEAQSICGQTQDLKATILAYNLEALILSKQQMYSNAIETFEKAIALSNKYYPVPETARWLYLNLGDTHYRMEMYDKALYYYNITFKLSTDQHIMGILYYSYGEIYYETGDFEMANTYINKAAELAKKFKLTSEYLQYLVLKAKINLKSGSDEVADICLEGIKEAEKTKLYRKKKEFHYILAKYYDKQGNKELFMRETKNLFQLESLLQREGM